nr:MFS transporter [Streptomyces hoynatensis]
MLLCAVLPLLDFFIVNVALPSIDRDLDAGPALLELIVAGYGVAYAVLLVLGGRLGDLAGRRRLMTAGLAAFGLTSLACGLAPGAWSLVAARIGQGASAALLLPQCLATLQATTQGARRARAMSLYGAAAGLSMVAGQILGGLLVAADLAGSGWRAVFLLNVPVVLVALPLVATTVPGTRSERPASVDAAGTVLLAASLSALLLPLTEGRAVGWPTWTWLSLAAFPLLGAWFLVVERRRGRGGEAVPLVPLGLLRLPGMARGLPALALCVGGFGGFMFVLAVTFQDGLHYGPVRAGLTLTPYAVWFFAASLAGPRLIARHGTRVVTWGAGLQALGLALLALAVARGWPDLGFLVLCPGLSVAGFGQGLQLPALMRFVLAEVPAAEAGVGGGVMSTTQQSAAALGVALQGALFLSVASASGMDDALVTALLTQILAVLATGALGLFLPRPKP